MKRQTIYIAEDGTRFDTEKECHQYELSKRNTLTIDELVNLIVKDVKFPNDDLYDLLKFSEKLIEEFEKENGLISKKYINKNGRRLSSRTVLDNIIKLKLEEVVRICFPHMRNATSEQIRVLFENAYNKHGSHWVDVMDELIDLIDLIKNYNSKA